MWVAEQSVWRFRSRNRSECFRLRPPTELRNAGAISPPIIRRYVTQDLTPSRRASGCWAVLRPAWWAHRGCGSIEELIPAAPPPALRIPNCVAAPADPSCASAPKAALTPRIVPVLPTSTRCLDRSGSRRSQPRSRCRRSALATWRLSGPELRPDRLSGRQRSQP